MATKQDVEKALADAHRLALVETVRKNASLTLTDIARLARGKLGSLVGSITVGELMGGPPPRAGKRSARASAQTGFVDTQTPTARHRYDQSLLSALTRSGQWLNAQQLRAIAGGSPLQARKALARLCDRHNVEWKGQARATKYRAPK